MNICVVGLGYVGLPLAVAFAQEGNTVVGFDVSEQKIEKLRSHIDPNGEISSSVLQSIAIQYTTDPSKMTDSDFIIVAVPTPITKSKTPDLTYVKNSATTVGSHMKQGATVVLESTVYPGVTEEICVPLLEQSSGKQCGVDFFVGYSPERINPGDTEHSLDKVIKVVSGMDENSAESIASLYRTVAKAGVHIAPTIKTAEAAKVIENIQRDLNIALMNELSLIFHRMGIKTDEVLDAAYTKWNFHKYTPGLLGGHCIGVDPYYLTHKAQELGYHPDVILAGRRVNDTMHTFVVDLVIKALSEQGHAIRNSKVLILGMTFKENVKDARNSRAKDVIQKLKEFNISVVGHDPHLSHTVISEEFGATPVSVDEIRDIDCIVLCTGHAAFKSLTLPFLKEKMKGTPLLIDVRNFYSRKDAEALGFLYYSL